MHKPVQSDLSKKRTEKPSKKRWLLSWLEWLQTVSRTMTQKKMCLSSLCRRSKKINWSRGHRKTHRTRLIKRMRSLPSCIRSWSSTMMTIRGSWRRRSRSFSKLSWRSVKRSPKKTSRNLMRTAISPNLQSSQQRCTKNSWKIKTRRVSLNQNVILISCVLGSNSKPSRSTKKTRNSKDNRKSSSLKTKKF